MSPTARRADPKDEARTRHGLFRAILAGAGHTLADAFANLEHAPEVRRIEVVHRQPTRQRPLQSVGDETFQHRARVLRRRHEAG